mgnify:FL=1
MKRESFACKGFIAAVTFFVGMQAACAENAAADDVFASVGGTTISRQDFEREVYAAARQTFYHGKAPGAEEYIEFRKGVADKMIERQLLLEEAERREIEPDTPAIDARIAQYELQYGDTDRWQTEGPAMVATLRERFEDDSLLERLEEDVREIDAPDTATVKEFYDEHPELFTQPASNRIAVILFAVQPSAGAPAWEAAREEAGRVIEQLESGAEFAELASLYSSDASADSGGDMGYQHEGALSPDAEVAIAALDVGGVSEPVDVLEGVAILKLLDRRPQRLRDFHDVEERATQLWLRQAGDERWQALVADLRAKADIRVDTDYLANIPSYDD